MAIRYVPGTSKAIMSETILVSEFKKHKVKEGTAPKLTITTQCGWLLKESNAWALISGRPWWIPALAVY